MRTNNSVVNTYVSTIARYDAPLAERIKSRPVDVFVITGENEFTNTVLQNNIDFMDAMNIGDDLPSAYGITIPRNGANWGPEVECTIWLNEPEIERWAAENNTDVALFGALVMAHEFAHIDGAGEVTAYAAGCVFAHKTGNRQIVQMAITSQRKNGEN